MGARQEPQAGGLALLRGKLEAIYQPLAHEIEARTAILGITLNEAFSERRENRHQMAWSVVGLAVGEWVRLTELVEGLQTVLFKYLPTAHGIVLVRLVSVGHFKSRTVVDNTALYEFLDQVLFSSRRRFALRLRSLSRNSDLLSKEFRRASREGALTLDSSDELWARLDYCFHDVDLIAKETLLAFHTLLLCLSPKRAQDLAVDLQALLGRGPRVSVYTSHQ